MSDVMPGVVASRHRLITEHGTIKCDREAAQSLADGMLTRHVEHSTIILLTGGSEVLGAWEPCDCPAPKTSAVGLRCANCGHGRGKHRVSSGPSECLFEYTGGPGYGEPTSASTSITRCRCPKFEKE